MKKHTRLLSVLLALALLFTSVFITSVLASEGEGESTTDTPVESVGTYTAPEGSWAPESDDVCFAVWTSEDDFLTGKAPTLTSVTNEITESHFGGKDADTKTFYVHLFADCTTLTSAQHYTGRYHGVVINLAGHTLDIPKGIRIGNGSGVLTAASLVIKNGTVNHTGGQMQTRQQSELRFDNVVYNFTGGIFYDEASKVIEFKNSTLNVENAGTNMFDLSIVSNSAYTNTLNFINTDIIQTADATQPLIRISTSLGSDAKNAYKVIFDKDSTLVRHGEAQLIALNSSNPDRTTAFPVFKVDQNLVFECGFSISSDVIYDEYVYSYVNKSSGKTLYNSKVESVYASYSRLNFSVIKDGETTDYMITEKNGMKTFAEPLSPEQAWSPEKDTTGTDYTGMTYAMWATEMDYLLGNPPVKFSTVAQLDTALIASNNRTGTAYKDPSFIPGFVRLYTDVTLKAQVNIGATQKLVIDFGGHKVSNTKVLCVPGGINTSLTLKNGSLDMSGTAKLTTTGYDSTLIFEDLDITSSVKFFTSCTADYVRFTGCTFVDTKGETIELGATKSDIGLSRSEFIVEDTDFVFLDTTNRSAFVITENVTGDALWDITLDKNSSIKGTASFITLAEYYKNGHAPFVAAQNVKVEKGFLYNDSETLPAEYIFIAVDSASGAAQDAVVKTANDTVCKIETVDSLGGGNTDVEAPEIPDPAPETPVIPDPGPGEDPEPSEPEYPTDKGQYTAPEGAWVPGEEHYGITYGLWLSEADYLAGMAPVKWSDDKGLDGALIGSDSNGTVYADASFIPGYMHIFRDVENTAAQIVTGHEQKLIINLGGCKLTDKKGFRVGGSSSSHPNASLVIKNGYWNYLSGQIQLRYDVVFSVENVVFDVSNSQIFYWASADFITFKDCQFIVRSNVHFALLASYPQHNAPRSTLSFENTEMILTKPVDRLFEIGTSNYGTTAWDIYFDADSSISGEIKELVRLQEKFIGGSLYPFITRQNLFVELGFKCSDTSILNEVATFRTFDNKGIEVPPQILPSSDDEASKFYMALVNPDTTVPADGDLYAISDGKLTELVSSIEGIDLAYMYVAPGARFKNAKMLIKDDNGISYISCKELQQIPAGSEVIFFADLTYDSTGSTMGQGRIHGINKGVVFDLGGHAFKFDVRFQFENSFTFKNGTISCENATTTPFYGCVLDETYSFIDVDIVFTVKEGVTEYYLFEVHSGNVYMKGGSISAVDKVAFRLIEGTENTVTLDGVTVTANILVEKTYYPGTDLNFTVNNSKINVTGFVFRLLGTYAEDKGERAEFVLKNSFVNGKLMSADTITAPLATLTVNDTYFSEVPTVPAPACTLVMPRGQKLMSVEGAELPFAIKTLGVGIKTNITLESVFGIQFFIPADTAMTTITIGSVVYNVSDLTETVVYDGTTYLVVAVKDILPSEAAEVIDIVIVYTEGELVNTLTTGYSVLDYVNTVLSSDISFYVKELVVAATEYIAMAYDYVGKENDELNALRENVNYLANKGDAAEIREVVANIDDVKFALSGATLNLGATMKLRFTLNETYTGALTLNGTEYEVMDGKVGELGYVELELAAYEMYDTVIEIAAGDKTGTYSLASYVTGLLANEEATELDKALAQAFYTYTWYANIYYGVMNN